jgi:hypothetical protein
MLRECLQLQAFTIVISVTNHLILLGFFSLFSLLVVLTVYGNGDCVKFYLFRHDIYKRFINAFTLSGREFLGVKASTSTEK